MSNRLTVFDLDPASPNVLVGGKRPRTTLTPTIVTRDGKPFLAVGTPGGDTQDQNILQTLLNVILAKQNLQQAIESPRFESAHFHQSFAEKVDAPGQRSRSRGACRSPSSPRSPRAATAST